jgi:TDG/mug DNA glycosylase family protein
MSGEGNRVIESWRGEEVETLRDLLKPGLRAVCVGINPSPVSVAAGHYYQGRLGKLFFSRLREAGVISAAPPGQEDDAAFAEGVGFTDIVKLPTPRGHHLNREDFEIGKPLLEAKLKAATPVLIIFTYKKAAVSLLGQFSGHGFVNGLEVGGSPAFVMPGPFEEAARARTSLEDLKTHSKPE